MNGARPADPVLDGRQTRTLIGVHFRMGLSYLKSLRSLR